MPRLFTALEVPVSVGFQLSLLQGGLPGARWISAENFHVTLRFIGDIDERLADDITDALSRGHRRKPFDVRLNGLDVFGGKQPHSVFARVEPNQALVDLQGEHERILQRLGLPAEQRKFTPHVTLARLNRVAPGTVAGWLAMQGAWSMPAFAADRFVLYSSRDSVGGGPYLLEEAYPFAA